MILYDGVKERGFSFCFEVEVVWGIEGSFVLFEVFNLCIERLFRFRLWLGGFYKIGVGGTGVLRFGVFVY